MYGKLGVPNVPAMTTTQLADLVTKYGPSGTVFPNSIPTGSQVWNTTTGTPQVFNGTNGWVTALTQNSAGDVSGASGTLVASRTYTWATLPLPANYIGNAYITDIGPSGSLWRSNGSTWGIIGGSAVLARGHTDLSVSASSTAEEDLVSITIPAGLMGANGQLAVTHFWSATNSANNKTTRIKLGGTAFFAVVQTTVGIFMPPPLRIWNRNSQSSQISFAAANGNTTVATGTPATLGTVDTSVATNLVISGQKATGTETLTLYAYSVELIRP